MLTRRKRRGNINKLSRAARCSLKTKQCKVEIKPDVRTNITSVINVNQNNFDFLKSLSRFFINNFYGEFDPGSGRTLAACLTHASRTENGFSLLKKFLVANG